MSYFGVTKGFMHPNHSANTVRDLYTPRTNVGMDATPNSMIAKGDSQTELQTIEARPHELPIPDLPDGSIDEGVSLAGTLYTQDEY